MATLDTFSRGARQLKDPRIGMTHNLGGAPRENVSSVAIVGRYE